MHTEATAWRRRRQELSATRRAEEEQRAEANRQAALATAAYLRQTDPFTGERVVPGDLRMCGRCHAGPWRKQGCNDMRAHSTWFSSHTGDRTHNRCRNCMWFEPDWRNWPVWDGVMGPH